MTVGLCLPPLILDQSVVTDSSILEILVDSMAILQELFQEEKAKLILTEGLSQMCDPELFEWEPPRTELQEIHRLFSEWLLQPNYIVYISAKEMQKVLSFIPHSIPYSSKERVLSDEWANEVGRLLVLHNRCAKDDEYFIGVACPFGLVHGEPEEYEEHQEREFPLTGRNNLFLLKELFEPDFSHQDINKQITFDLVEKNIHLLGGQVQKAKGTSHHKVRFDNQRPWPLDANESPFKDSILRGLVPITGKSLPYIKFVLIYGRHPDNRSKLANYIA